MSSPTGLPFWLREHAMNPQSSRLTFTNRWALLKSQTIENMEMPLFWESSAISSLTADMSCTVGESARSNGLILKLRSTP